MNTMHVININNALSSVASVLGRDASLARGMALIHVALCGDDGATIGDIEHALGVSQASASRAGAALRSAGLAKYQVDPYDGRLRPLVLTDAGRDAVTGMYALGDMP